MGHKIIVKYHINYRTNRWSNNTVIRQSKGKMIHFLNGGIKIIITTSVLIRKTVETIIIDLEYCWLSKFWYLLTQQSFFESAACSWSMSRCAEWMHSLHRMAFFSAKSVKRLRISEGSKWASMIAVLHEWHHDDIMIISDMQTICVHLASLLMQILPLVSVFLFSY